MNAIEWLRGKLHIEPDERKIGKKYYEKCDKDTATELEASYSTYMILKDRGYEPDDVLILLEEDNGKFTGKKLTVQVYSTEREIEGLLDGYCVLMVENMGLAAWKKKRREGDRKHERIEKIHKRDLVCKPPGTSCMSSVTRTTELTRACLT